MRIFLSYAHPDKELAKKLGSRLEEQGFEVWDPARDVLPGDNIALKVGDALETSDAVVAILSPASMKSEWVKREIQFALGDPKKEGRLFPVLARGTMGTIGFPWVLTRFPVFYASQGLEGVTKKIASALRAKTAHRMRTARALGGE
jgi:TIR domain